jgi:hypothetical protein
MFSAKLIPGTNHANPICIMDISSNIKYILKEDGRIFAHVLTLFLDYKYIIICRARCVLGSLYEGN